MYFKSYNTMLYYNNSVNDLFIKNYLEQKKSAET